MKDQYDNKTVDCFPSTLAVAYGERMILVLGNIIKKRSRTSTDDVKSWLQMSKRSAQRYLKSLVVMGLVYTVGNNNSEYRYYLSGKAKQLFGVQG